MVIGSKAIKYYYPDSPREPKDIDIVVTTPSNWIKTKGVNFDIFEYEVKSSKINYSIWSEERWK